ncbi:MAG: type II toxin-antitoxin system RelE/ParE family toxin [Deltaproteobacteria bacterium]
MRIRIGRYRVIYEVEGQKLLILILKIGYRKDIYQ